MSVEEEMLDFCHDCPDYDVCVIDPEEFEDECLRLRGSEQKVSE